MYDYRYKNAAFSINVHHSRLDSMMIIFKEEISRLQESLDHCYQSWLTASAPRDVIYYRDLCNFHNERIEDTISDMIGFASLPPL